MGMLTGKHRDRSYLDDFQINEQGEYEYQGVTYRWQIPDNRKPALRGLWMRLTCAAILMLAAGCIPAPGVDHIFYLLIPYAAGLACCLWSAMALSRMSGEKDPMREYVFNRSVLRLPVTFLFAALFGILCTAAQVVYLLLHGGGDKILYGFLFMLLEAAAVFLLLFARRAVLSLQWIRTERTAAEEDRPMRSEDQE
jgi:hypothetical protein